MEQPYGHDAHERRANRGGQQLLPCADGSFWVLTASRLRKCFARSWQAEALVTSNGQPDQIESARIFSQCASFFVDSLGGVWFAHDQKGIGHVRPDGAVSWVTDPQQVLNSSVQCWFEDHEGNVWLGLADGGLCACARESFTWSGRRKAWTTSRPVPCARMRMA